MGLACWASLVLLSLGQLWSTPFQPGRISEPRLAVGTNTAIKKVGSNLTAGETLATATTSTFDHLSPKDETIPVASPPTYLPTNSPSFPPSSPPSPASVDFEALKLIRDRGPGPECPKEFKVSKWTNQNVQDAIDLMQRAEKLFQEAVRH